MSNERRKAYRFGLSAERMAAFYLRGKGYRVRAERYRNHGGEIDLVATKRRLLVVVEVKARKRLEQCEYSITPVKQEKLMRAVSGLMAGHSKITGLTDAHERNIRFDVIWIAPWRWPIHIKDAWRL